MLPFPSQEKIDNCDLSLLNDQKQLEKRLYGIAQKISSYDYERLTYIFKKIVEITDSEDARTVAEDNVNLLEMLAMYQRTGSSENTGTSIFLIVPVFARGGDCCDLLETVGIARVC